MSLQYVYGTRIFTQLEKIVTQYIQRPPRSCIDTAILGILSGCSYLFRLYMSCRQFCYTYRILPIYTSAIPVISIGNITAGGTGKTLLTCLLVRELRDVQCAVALQGYRSVMGRRRGSVRVTPRMSAKYCGDEPLLLAKKFPNCAVFSGRDRIKAAELAVMHKVACLILDDGLQHHKIHRDIQIIVMRSGDLFGRGAFLPRGYLREHPKRLKSADLIVIHQTKEAIFNEEVRQIRVYSSAPIIGTRVYISSIIDYHTGREVAICAERIGLFCGIGTPSSFIDTVQSLGYEIMREFCIADHEEWQTNLLHEFSLLCKSKGATRLLCTEKDAARLSNAKLALPVGVVGATIQITKNQSEFTQCIHRIRSLI